ncbi:MAG: endonuclease VIII [Clostridia bacterium]
MLEIPEAIVIARQVTETLSGRRIERAIANHSPHRFAWFHGDPAAYDSALRGRTIEGAVGFGSMVEISAGPMRIVLAEGTSPRYYRQDDKLPAKHQLLLELDDGSSLVGSVQMYGAVWVFPDGEFDNQYYLGAKRKPSPLTGEFDYAHFKSLLEGKELESLSAKAFLATEQRIPGLGNGVLQDILWTARIHPKRKVSTLSEEELRTLFDSMKSVLRKMVDQGGRDTERDLFGNLGGYETVLSRNTVGSPCPACGTLIKKEAFLGGSIYYCEGCQSV